jgi:hypothetical protein
MGGLARIAKMYGGMIIQSEGKSVELVYDYFHARIYIFESVGSEILRKSYALKMSLRTKNTLNI